MDLTLQKMIQSGIQMGHDFRDWNPLIRKYIVPPTLVPNFSNCHVIDLVITYSQIKKAKVWMKESIKSRNTIILVGTSDQSSPSLQNR